MEFSSEIFLHNLAQTSPAPFLITIEKAEGVYLHSPDGKKYIDLISGIGVSNLGHRHPHVVDAIKSQVERHLHVMVYGEYIQRTPNLLAKKLTSLLPPALNCAYFVNSGTEANEASLKLAKRYTGRTEIIACRGAYHGSTHGSLSVSGNETKKQAFRPLLPGVRFINFNDIGDLKYITSSTACVIIETVQGDAGVRIPSQEYMEALRDACTRNGAMLIMDEIQCGMGRTGTLFAFEQFGIAPDIVTMGKAFGGGLPIAAFVSDYQIMKSLTHDPMLGHITTFGGNPVCCAAALATLEVIENEKVLDHVEAKGALFEQKLQHPAIKEMRRIGLMFAIDLGSAELVDSTVRFSLEEGVICYWFLSNPASLRIAPPLTITESEIHKSCGIILRALDKAVSQASQ